MLLPDKLSKLIRVAIEDLKAVEASPGYEVDMVMWHRAPEKPDGRCSVCLAGAVMAKSLRLPRHENICSLADLLENVAGVDEDSVRALMALDLLRANESGEALTHWMDLDSIYVTDYDVDRKEFFAAMDALADRLDAYGL